MPIERITLDRLWPCVPPRQAAGHKGTFGSLTLVAGSPLTPGAAILCALGALRSGVGLVRWATDSAMVALAPVRPPELMLALRDRLSEGAEVARAEVWAQHISSFGPHLTVGPGLGQSDDAQAVLAAILSQAQKPMCVDADALNLLARRPTLWAQVPHGSVCTPHPKEMARLLSTNVEAVLQAPLEAAAQLAETSGCVIVLKGATTTVAGPSGALAQTSDEGISALGHGGTGDVLAGLVGGLLAQRFEPYMAAQLAVALHRAAALRAARRHGHTGALASDVALALGEVWAMGGR